MNPDEVKALQIGAEAALKPFSNLLEKLFGGAVEEVGGMWQDSLKVRRLGRRLKLYGKIQRMIHEAGFEPQEISDQIWFPALQAASLEDQEYLQERWAALLANAAHPERHSEVPPSFVGILRELSSSDVKLLNAVYDFVCTSPFEEKPRPRAARIERDMRIGDENTLAFLFGKLGVTRTGEDFYLHDPGNGQESHADRSDFRLALDNLLRQQLIRKEIPAEAVAASGEREITEKDGKRIKLGPRIYYHLFLTVLGYQLIAMCQKPTRVEAP